MTTSNSTNVKAEVGSRKSEVHFPLPTSPFPLSERSLPVNDVILGAVVILAIGAEGIHVIGMLAVLRRTAVGGEIDVGSAPRIQQLARLQLVFFEFHIRTHPIRIIRLFR